LRGKHIEIYISSESAVFDINTYVCRHKEHISERDVNKESCYTLCHRLHLRQSLMFEYQQLFICNFVICNSIDEDTSPLYRTTPQRYRNWFYYYYYYYLRGWWVWL